MASFVYEIGWIRMLSLVLGASTHAFELMLSAFILGLALGGLWVKKRIEALRHEERFLGYVQVVMGLLALSTLPLYGNTFEIMQWVMSSVEKTQQGYVMFNLSSHAIALLIMLPTTFCAGITLPVITHVLLKKGVGEKAIGGVYALNTLGAIGGVLLAVHFLMPLLGLKNLIIAGAGIDLTVGLMLLWFYRQRQGNRFSVAAAVSGIAVLVAVFVVRLNPYEMASGVYRHGNLYTPENAELVFHQDGKTASVDLVRVKELGELSIITNGKPDASINMTSMRHVSPDEYTMTLLGALPLAHKPDARQAAVIGLGSGMTSHVLLSMESMERVDTIEIEAAMVEAAKNFRPKVERVYASPRSHIYIEDAKTFFSTHNKRYDVIVSEPSNPWVSGIASLFTGEFYRVVAEHLTHDGVFVQWLHLYEINDALVASVMKALSSAFDDYLIYAANNHDIVIVSKRGETLAPPSTRVFSSPEMAALLARIGVRTHEDLMLHEIGGKAYLQAMFGSYAIAGNSDYYPVLDLNATKARFLQQTASALVDLNAIPLRMRNFLYGRDTNPSRASDPATRVTPRKYFGLSNRAYAATLMRDFILTGTLRRQFHKLPQAHRQAAFVLRQYIDC
jgi:spermidine synthase